MRSPTLSLILPVYNEHRRLVPGVAKVLDYLERQPYAWELIIVDDGSDIPARQMFHTSYKDLPVFFIRVPKNRGKGAAIAAGVKRASGRCIVFCDIDLSVPIGSLSKLLRLLRTYPIVIGSRRLADSTIAIHQPPVREAMGRVFTWLSNVICDTHVADATCGMKGFEANLAKKLFCAMRIDRWVFDTELLFLARKWGVPVCEMPVSWSNKPESKVRPWDSVQSLVDLLRIRYYDATGKYQI